MKSILCYGDSNTWGNIAGSYDPKLTLSKRFDYETRWPGRLQKLLGRDYQIIEAGLNGRSTSFDETNSSRPSRNGLATLPGILEMHYPLDWIIFMLGTNDLRIQYQASLERVTQGMQQLIQYVKAGHLGANFSAPKVMLIAPAPIVQVDGAAAGLFDEGSVIKSQKLAACYQDLAADEQCLFLNAGDVAKASLVDGVHMDAESHAALAQAVKSTLNL